MNEALWYLGRGTGVVTLVLLSLSVALGILTRSGRPLPGLPSFAVQTVHRNAGLLAVLMMLLHMVGLLFDEYAQLRMADLVIPFGAGYRPLWMGLGTLAADLTLVIVVSSMLRHRIGPAAWRALHWLTYASWPLAVGHGLGTGSDAGTIWFTLVTGVCVLSVVVALGWRVRRSFDPDWSSTPVVPVAAPRTGVEALR